MIWRRLALLAGVLVVLSLGFGSWILLTESGLRWSMSVVHRISGGTFSVQSVQGRLTGQIVLGGIDLSPEGFSLTADSMQLRLAPSGLLRTTVIFDSITAEGVDLKLNSPDSSNEPLRFPLAFELGTLTIESFSVVSPEMPTPLTIDTVRFSGRSRGSRLIIESLQLANSVAGIEMKGDLDLVPVPLLKARTTWTINSQVIPRFTGRGTLEGTLAEIRARQEVLEPFRADITGILDMDRETPGWEAWADLIELDPGRIFLDRHTVKIKGHLESSGTFESIQVTGDLTASGFKALEDTIVRVDLEGSRDGKRWELSRLTALIPGATARMEATGHYSVGESGPEFELNSSWARMHWPVNAPTPLLTSPEGNFSINGRYGEYQAEMLGVLGVAGFNPEPFNITASGGDQILRIDEAAFALGPAYLTAEGTLTEIWDGVWQLTLADMGDIEPTARGQLAVDGTLTGERSSPLLTAALRGQDLLAGGISLESFQGTFVTALAQVMESTIDLSFQGLERGNKRVERIALTGGGDPASHFLEAEITNGPHAASLNLLGQVTGKLWKGTARAGGLGGTLAAEGTFSWAESLSWDGSITAKSLEPLLVWPHSPEDLGFDVRFSGSVDQGVFISRFQVPHVEGRFRDIPLEGSALVELKGDIVELLEADLNWGSAHMQASGTLAQTWDIMWDVSVSDAGHFVEGIEGRGAAQGLISGPRTVPELQLSLEVFDAGVGKISTSGFSGVASITADDGFPLTFRLLFEPVTTGGVTTGAVEATGALKGGDHEVFLRALNPLKPDATVSVKGRIAEQAWTGSAATDLLGGQFELDGRLVWKEGVSWSTAARGSELNPGTVLPEWPGSLSIGFTTEGSLVNGTPRLALDLEHLQGTLRDSNVSGTARFRKEPDKLEVDVPSLKAGGASFAASISSGQEVQGSWSLIVKDLNDLLPGMRGSLRSIGEVEGAPSTPSFYSSISASGLGGSWWAVDDLSVETRIMESGRKSGRIRAKASGISAGQVTIDEATLESDGTVGKHNVALGGKFPGGHASVLMDGVIEERSWTGNVSSAELNHKSGGNWSLEKTADLVLSIAEGTVERLCVVSGDNRLCLSADWAQGQGRGSLNILKAPLSLLTLWSGDALKAEGDVNGEIRIGNNGNGWWGNARLSCTEGTVPYPTGFGRWGSLTFIDSIFTSTLDENGLYGSFETALGAGGNQDRLTWSVRLPKFSIPPAAESLTDQEIKGTVAARVADMGFIQAFVPEVEKAAGVLTVSMDLGETVGDPVVDGYIQLKEGSARIPLLGLTLNPLKGRLTGDHQGGTVLSLTAGSGQGQFTATGTADALSTKNRTFQINIKGENFTVAKTPIISMVLSPDLLFSAEGDTFSLTGTVRVPEADLKPKEIPVTNTTSSDVIVIDAVETIAEVPKARVVGDVTLILEDKVSFEGFGLTGHLSGTLRILEEPGKVTSGTGELTITDGQYRAYGQKLTIERGKLIFSGGPVENPGLDIRAARRSGDVVAGVQVGGTIMAPEVSLYSDPAMDQADALSYLLLGKPLRRASGDEGQVLASAALTMGLTQGEALAGRIGRVFGFEEVTIQTESEVEESAIVVGRYLTPQVYVRYGVGIFQAFSLFQFGYHISDRFLLQGESGAQTGTDLFYTIEK